MSSGHECITVVLRRRRAAQNGNWYDIKEFRISYTVSVLR